MNDDTATEPEAMKKALFSQLILMLTTSTLQQLGKMVNPMTQATEISLEGAAMSIDMLDMLAQKTKGNLDDEEQKFLNEALTSLRMNFVEVQRETENQAPAPQGEPVVAAKTPSASEDDRNVKFKKKYD